MESLQSRVIVIVIVVLLIGVSVGWGISTTMVPTSLVPVKFTTGWVFSGCHTPLFVAEEKGWFTEEGIQIDIVRGYGSVDVITKVAAGTYEGGMGDPVAFTEAKSKNPDLDVIALLIAYDSNPNSMVGIKGRPNTPTTIQEIEGKKISTTGGSFEVLFPSYAREAGIDPEKVELVIVSYGLVPTLVEKGDTDLSSGYIASNIGNFIKMGYEIEDLVLFKFSDVLRTLYGDAILVRKSWVEEHPESARGFIRAYIRGLLYTYEHPEEAIDILLEREPLLDRAGQTRDLEISIEEFYFTDRILERGIGYHTSEDVADMINVVVEGFELERTPSVDEIYTSEYLPPLEELKVT